MFQLLVIVRMFAGAGSGAGVGGGAGAGSGDPMDAVFLEVTSYILFYLLHVIQNLVKCFAPL